MHYVKNNDIKDRKKISKITNRKKKLENILKYINIGEKRL